MDEFKIAYWLVCRQLKALASLVLLLLFYNCDFWFLQKSHVKCVMCYMLNVSCVTCQLRHVPYVNCAMCRMSTVPCAICQLRHVPYVNCVKVLYVNCVKVSYVNCVEVLYVNCVMCHMSTAPCAICQLCQSVISKKSWIKMKKYYHFIWVVQ